MTNNLHTELYFLT